VEAAELGPCDGARRRSAIVGGRSGYLSGVWAAETGCGTVDAPWQVRVERGQRIDVTLYDFSVPPATTGNRTSSAVANPHIASAAAAAAAAAGMSQPISHSQDGLCSNTSHKKKDDKDRNTEETDRNCKIERKKT